VAAVLSVPLDRTRPLWELHVFESVEGDHAAALLKLHHAMADGLSALRIASVLFDLEPGVRPLPPPAAWRPRPLPTPAELVADAVLDRVGSAGEVVPGLAAAPARALRLLDGARELLGLGRPPPGPFDAPVRGARRFALADVPFERVRAIKDALGGTVNDVVLAVVAGAVHELLRARRVPTRGRTLRALMPVSVRGEEEAGLIGNRVAPALIDLPVGPMGPRRRLALVRRAAAELKASGMALGADALIGLGALAPPALLAAAARIVARGRWFNLVVSNVPAPQVPVYLRGARVLATYPAMPLARTVALSIGATSVAGTMAFGLTGDRDAMPDLDRLAAAIEDQVAALAKAAGV
jgi:WS/DGAT/MGAT family acyltransferase